MTGSDWQRQALAAVRASAAGQRAAAHLPDAETVKKRIEAQQVPDMLAAVDPQPSPAIPQAPSASVAGAAAPPPSGAPAGPVVSAASGDEPMAGKPVVVSVGSSGLKKFLIILAVLLLLGGGASAYFLFFAGKDKGQGASQQQAGPVTVDLSTLSDAAFVAPPAEDGIKQTTEQDGITVKLTNADQSCMLAFGILPKDKLPAEWAGKTAIEITNLGIDEATLQDTMTVDIDSTAYQLTLRDANSQDKRYTLPLKKFTASLDNITEDYALGVATLRDGSVATVLRFCRSTNGPIPQELIQSFDGMAAKITVRTGSQSAAD